MSELWSAAQLIFLAIVSLAIGLLVASEPIEAGRSCILVRIRDDRRGLQYKGRTGAP